jgi:predicted GH43/DUF377 family glycosyl hydrolase
MKKGLKTRVVKIEETYYVTYTAYGINVMGAQPRPKI